MVYEHLQHQKNSRHIADFKKSSLCMLHAGVLFSAFENTKTKTHRFVLFLLCADFENAVKCLKEERANVELIVIK